MPLTAYYLKAVVDFMRLPFLQLPCRLLLITGLFFTLFGLSAMATGGQQTISLSVTNAPLEKVVKEIQKQSGYTFVYTRELLQMAKPVSVRLNNVRIDEALAICLKEQPITFSVVDRMVILRVKEVKGVVGVVDAGEPVTVSGRVTDDEGNPLVGANVKVKGSNVGTVTDKDGKFSLANVDEGAMLEISYVGRETQTVAVRGRSMFAIVLGQKLSVLDETVVIAYGTTTKRLATGNVSTVKARDIETQPVNNPLLALQGRVPGLFISQANGFANGAVTVTIQGANSIRGANDPLIVIDGTPYPTYLPKDGGPLGSGVSSGRGGANPLGFINPADIESIDILKDADATAIYGSRAANGAILITTKKGKVGKTRIDINYQQGQGKVAKKLEMLNSRQYLDMRYEALKNDAININTIPNNNSLYYDLKLWDTTSYTDWQKTLIGATSQINNINASVTGGSTAMQFLVGATYNRTTTVFPGNFDDRRGSVHFNLNGSSNAQRLKIQLSGSYMYDNNHLPSVDLTSNAIKLEPVAPSLYTSNGALNWAPDNSGNSTWDNPLIYLLYQDFRNTTNNFLANAQLTYSILPGFELKSNFGFSNLQTNTYYPIPLVSFRPQDRPFVQRSASFNYRSANTWIIEPQVTWKKKIMKGSIEVLVGTTIQKSTNDYLGVQGRGFSSDLLLKNINAAVSVSSSASTTVFKYNALFGRLNLNWSNRYILNLTTRRDGSSRFGNNNKFHNFGSLGLGWIFSEERFSKVLLPLLSYGKLKVSYGLTGNDQIADYSYLSLYGILSSPVPYQGANGLFASNIPNPYLQWEETRKIQGGIELGFLSDRIILNVNYAYNRCSNQLLNFVLPTITGFSSISENFPATMRNINWELALNTTNYKIKNFLWETNLNVTIPRNKLVSFPNIESTSYATGTQGVIVGQPWGVQKVYHYLGVDPSTGRSLIEDNSGNPTSSPVSSRDKNTLVSSVVKLYGGFQNCFSYKRFRFDVLFQFVRQKGKADMYYGTGWPAGVFAQGQSNQPVSVLERWQKPGDISKSPRFSSNFSVANWANVSDIVYSFDASYIRLKNVSFSWLFPVQILQKAQLESARLFFCGQNLATITRYTGLDPETMASTVLPPLRVWTLGIQIGL